MSETPELMSQRELDDYLDQLVKQGKEDTTEFEHAYSVWESRDSE